MLCITYARDVMPVQWIQFTHFPKGDFDLLVNPLASDQEWPATIDPRDRFSHDAHGVSRHATGMPGILLQFIVKIGLGN